MPPLISSWTIKIAITHQIPKSRLSKKKITLLSTTKKQTKIQHTNRLQSKQQSINKITSNEKSTHKVIVPLGQGASPSQRGPASQGQAPSNQALYIQRASRGWSEPSVWANRQRRRRWSISPRNWHQQPSQRGNYRVYLSSLFVWKQNLGIWRERERKEWWKCLGGMSLWRYKYKEEKEIKMMNSN